VGLTRAEQETVIQWNQEQQEVSFYSCVKSMWRKCERAGWTLHHSQLDHDGREISREYVAHVRLLRITCKSLESDASERERGRSRMLALGSRLPGARAVK
jgi:hypothetical protein